MPAALWVPAAISAASSVVSGIVKSRAAKKASEQQVEAGNKALDMYKQVYTPWSSAGQQAYTSLGSAMGLSMPQTSGAMPRPAAPVPIGRAFGGTAMPRPSPIGSSRVQPLSSLGGSIGGSVTMRAPNGMTKVVPKNLQAHYESMGAVVA